MIVLLLFLILKRVKNSDEKYNSKFIENLCSLLKYILWVKVLWMIRFSFLMFLYGVMWCIFSL